MGEVKGGGEAMDSIVAWLAIRCASKTAFLERRDPEYTLHTHLVSFLRVVIT